MTDFDDLRCHGCGWVNGHGRDCHVAAAVLEAALKRNELRRYATRHWVGAVVSGATEKAQRFGHTAWWVVYQHHPSHDVTYITQVHPPRSRKDAPTEPRLRNLKKGSK